MNEPEKENCSLTIGCRVALRATWNQLFAKQFPNRKSFRQSLMTRGCRRQAFICDEREKKKPETKTNKHKIMNK